MLPGLSGSRYGFRSRAVPIVRIHPTRMYPPIVISSIRPAFTSFPEPMTAPVGNVRSPPEYSAVIVGIPAISTLTERASGKQCTIPARTFRPVSFDAWITMFWPSMDSGGDQDLVSNRLSPEAKSVAQG